MITIWKSVLELTPFQWINIPKGAEIFCAREQNEQVCVWYRCDEAMPRRDRSIALVGTGHVAPRGGKYIGSAHLQKGAIVFHVFEAMPS